MQLDETVMRAIAESHARDRLAYLSLGGSARAAAGRLARLLFRSRQGIATAWHWTLRGSEHVLGVILDWLLWLADKILFGPYRTLVRAIVAIGRAIASVLKQLVGAALGLAGLAIGTLDGLIALLARVLPVRDSGRGLRARLEVLHTRLQRLRRLLPLLKRRWQRAIERGWRRLGELARAAIATLFRGIDWVSRNLMFRPLAWLFNPRLPGGAPLLGNETATRIAGFVLAAVALYLGVMLLAYIKAKALLLHGTINVKLWKVDAPLAVNLIKIGAAHAAISAGVAASKFVLLPVLAAARRGIKNNALTQAVAYRYVLRKAAAQRALRRTVIATASHAEAPRGALRFLDRLVEHIVAGTVPETYEVKLRRQQKGDTHLLRT